MSVSFLPLVFSAVAFGPLGGFAVGAVSNVWDLRESRLKWGVYTPIRGLTAATAGLAAWTLVPKPTTFGVCLWRVLSHLSSTSRQRRRLSA